MKKITLILLVILGLSLLYSGCAAVISSETMSRANRAVTVADVRNSPDAHKNEVILWAGEIVEAHNKKDGTIIEILQKPVNSSLKPKDNDISSGRFLAKYDGYLDVAIFAPGRAVTVAGRIQGEHNQLLGELEYNYPVVSVEEIYLWPRKEMMPGYYYTYPYVWDPWPGYYYSPFYYGPHYYNWRYWR